MDKVKEAIDAVDICLCNEQTLEMVEKPDKDGWIKTTIKEEVRVEALKRKISGLKTAIAALKTIEKFQEMHKKDPYGMISEDCVIETFNDFLKGKK